MTIRQYITSANISTFILVAFSELILLYHQNNENNKIKKQINDLNRPFLQKSIVFFTFIDGVSYLADHQTSANEKLI